MLGVLVPTLIMLWNAHYPFGLFWKIAVPVYLCIQTAIMAGSRRFAIKLGLDPYRAVLVSALGFVTVGLFPLIYLSLVYRKRVRQLPDPRHLDCRMPIIIDSEVYTKPGDST